MRSKKTVLYIAIAILLLVFIYLVNGIVGTRDEHDTRQEYRDN